jgi:murein L,D-transpeptidase YafK
MTERAISFSRRNKDYSVLIDKFSRKCLIYHNGVKKYEFDIELGKNWVGDKRHRGDNATPEGFYNVTGKFSGGKTKYYKALLIDYPNEKDKKRFRTEVANGSLPASARIGELIEIHGGGGRGVDWTEGCVALTDAEMDSVYKIIKVGTPVTIVGSTVDLENALEK